MRIAVPIRWAMLGLLGLGLQTSALGQADTAQKTPASNSAASKKTPSHKKHARTKKTAKKRGQQAIDSERARQIQMALIREHYLEGQPSGKWDDSTQAALRRFQADQGWQSKTIPDSRALIKLGLGPNQEHLLNPESAMTSAPVSPGTKSDPKARSADPPPASSQPDSNGTPQN